jgi:hemoglobin
MRIRQIGFVLVLVLSIAACGGKKDNTTKPGDKALYDRLGGKDAITAVVDDFVNTAATDEKISHFFKNTDPKDLKAKLVDQICEASGGPCKYTGKDMKASHKGMGVGGADFDALVQDLVGALDTFHVGSHEKDQLLGALAPMKSDIVEKK